MGERFVKLLKFPFDSPLFKAIIMSSYGFPVGPLGLIPPRKAPCHRFCEGGHCSLTKSPEPGRTPNLPTQNILIKIFNKLTP